MTGHYVPDFKRFIHAGRRIKRRVNAGMKRHEAEWQEFRLQERLRRYIDFVHDREFRLSMAERFKGGVDPR